MIKVKKGMEKYNLNVLYVEDEAITSIEMNEMLKERVNSIYSASSANEALKIFEEKNIDVLITDISMPVNNGLEMALKMRSEAPYLKIIVISAYSDTDYFLKAIDIGVDGFLLKPVDMSKLYKLLKKVSSSVSLSKAYAKQQEENKRLNERLTLSLKASNEGIWDIDFKTASYYANSAFLKMLSYEDFELEQIVKNWRSFFHPDDRRKLFDSVVNHVRQKEKSTEDGGFSCEVRMKKASGSWFWVLIRGKLSSWTEQSFRLTGTVDAIQMRKNAEEKLRAFNKRLKRQLDLAVQLQKKITIQPLIEGDGFRLHSRYVPCDEMAGDYLNALIIENSLYIISADVSGHGLMASFYSVILDTIAKTFLSCPIETHELMYLIHGEIRKYFIEQYFITAKVCKVDLDNMELFCTNAGHPPLYIFGPNGTRELNPKGSLLASFLKNSKFGSAQVKLGEGERFLLCTDGLLEFNDEKSGLSGEDILLDYLKDNYAAPGAEIVDGLLDVLNSANSNERFLDDISFCVFEKER